ncbi:hypothetical protein WJX81_008137 [Elliptochloris bilobata]|uniref:SGNH hydrolase-type esterase domain-containing protein n=1 Tax=Elliptochloris bilobata TaxID=381761 RepID=A0AAW1RSB8_9CHLO
MRLEKLGFVCLGAILSALLIRTTSYDGLQSISSVRLGGRHQTHSHQSVNIAVRAEPAPLGAGGPEEPNSLVTHEGLAALGRADAGFRGLLPPWLPVPAHRDNVALLGPPCLNRLVDSGADFVFIEYTANDGYHSNKFDPAKACANATEPRLDKMSRLDTPINRGLERLIRKLLKLPSRPFVVLVHWYATALALDFLQEAHFWQTAERDSGLLAEYYDVASVSVRNTFYHLFHGGQSLTGIRNESLFLIDHVHPNEFGHYHLAYPVVFYLEQALRWAVLGNPVAGAQGAARPNPEPTAHRFRLMSVSYGEQPLFYLNDRGWNF